MEVVRTERVFVGGEIVRNEYWVGIVKLSEGQSIVDFCCLVYR